MHTRALPSRPPPELRRVFRDMRKSVKSIRRRGAAADRRPPAQGKRDFPVTHGTRARAPHPLPVSSLREERPIFHGRRFIYSGDAPNELLSSR